VNLHTFFGNRFAKNMPTDVEIDVDSSGVHINRSRTDPVKYYIGIFLNPSHLPLNFNSDHYTSYFQRALFCPHLYYLMSFMHLMLCNYYIQSKVYINWSCPDRVNLHTFFGNRFAKNMPTDVEIDVDSSGVHINRVRAWSINVHFWLVNIYS
jgi:hypothetical protein